jgi:3-methyladenine DNA glycosylase AlkC
MAEPLKNMFGTDVPARLGEMVQVAFPEFDGDRYLAIALDGFEELELTDRARQISGALAEVLPQDRERAMEIVIDSLGPEAEEAGLTGMESFLYLPLVFFVADHGIDHFETAMRAQYELTKRFTAEFSIRAFIERYPEETHRRLADWASDPDPHVRRLVSEGTRPRLPWAPRLRGFQDDPSPVLELLELLKDDSAEYVRRSVANNLNDISKDHPERVVEVAGRWLVDATEHRERLVRHALRTLVKTGHAGALGLLGFSADSPVVIRAVRCQPQRVRIGEKVRIEVELQNPVAAISGALVDLRIHFVKAKGSTGAKVFKGAQLEMEAGETRTVRKSISLAQQSTRTHHAGEHRIEVLLNGIAYPGGSFEVV